VGDRRAQRGRAHISQGSGLWAVPCAISCLAPVGVDGRKGKGREQHRQRGTWWESQKRNQIWNYWKSVPKWPPSIPSVVFSADQEPDPVMFQHLRGLQGKA